MTWWRARSSRTRPSVRLLIAAEVGPVRLIDNCAGAVTAPPGAHDAVRHGVRAIANPVAHAPGEPDEPGQRRQLERIG